MFRQVRNDFSSKVQKYKNQIDRINKLTGSTIIYNDKTLHVEVPNFATEGVEYFQLKWATSTSGSHKEIIPMLEQILNALEVSNDPVRYNSIVSTMHSRAKAALKANTDKYHIAVPTQQDTNQVISEIKILAGEHWVNYDEEGINIGYLNPENPKTISMKVYYNDKAKLAHVLSGLKAYGAFEKNNITEFEKNISDVNDLYIARATIYFGGKYVGTGQNDREKELAAFILGTKLNIPKIYNHVPVEDILYEQASVLKDAVIKASKTEENNVVQESKASDASVTSEEANILDASKFINSSQQELIKVTQGMSPDARGKFLVELAMQQGQIRNAQKEQDIKKSMSLSGNELIKFLNGLPVDQREEIQEKIAIARSLEDSNKLGAEVTLTNGAKYEVKKIIDLLDKPNFTKQLTNILSKLSPEDSNLITKEIALKLAYISNKDMDKYDAVHEIVDNMSQTFIDEFNSYDSLTLDQMRTEEAKILGGGASYLE